MAKCTSIILLILVLLGLLVLTAFFIVFCIAIVYVKDHYNEIFSGISDSLFSSINNYQSTTSTLKDQITELSTKMDIVIQLLKEK